MTNYSAEYTKNKQQDIQKAIKKLENSSQEFQEIGPEDSNVRTWVTRAESDLGKKVKNKESDYKEYLPFIYEGMEYCIFAFPREN